MLSEKFRNASSRNPEVPHFPQGTTRDRTRSRERARRREGTRGRRWWLRHRLEQTRRGAPRFQNRFGAFPHVPHATLRVQLHERRPAKTARGVVAAVRLRAMPREPGRVGTVRAPLDNDASACGGVGGGSRRERGKHRGSAFVRLGSAQILPHHIVRARRHDRLGGVSDDGSVHIFAPKPRDERASVRRRRRRLRGERLRFRTRFRAATVAFPVAVPADGSPCR